MVTRKRLFFLSLLSGALFFLSWPPIGFPIILFVAFVPLLQIEQAISSGQTKAKRTFLFGLSYLTFFIWNVSTTWWVYNASLGGAAMAILANSLLMAMVFWIFHVVKKRLLTFNFKPETLNWLFPVLWLAFEHFHHRWDLTWPWLTLGNAFAKNHIWIQWYEFTGVPGGSLWVLALNLFFFDWLNGKPKKVFLIVPTLVVPILISYFIYTTFRINITTDLRKKIKVVCVQPNIDPYSEKFSSMNSEEQLNKMLELAKQKIDSSTDYLVFPETALTEDIWENDLDQTQSIKTLREFLKPYPKLKIITGASTWHLYEEGEKLTVTARKFKKQEGYYDAFNTALQIDNSKKIQIYHKSKLVPGVERMPYPAVFGFLENFAIDLGGTAGSLGTQEERTVFTGTEGIAPVICYESIYGEYVGEYINNGANLIFIITNDGWWRDTPGYKQHLLYGRLRAIESRRCIARSANTGISCFIDERGDFSQETEWWKPAVIKASINSNSEKTFYTRFGDIIGRICFYASGIILLVAIVLRVLPKKSS
ncbi:MAG TPA: apolipoprotein N-acyltransferase [Bacteroidia bacterium]